MTIAARASALTIKVHAVEDDGALCGARPSGGRWRRSELLPINCPRCLYALRRDRFAVCGIPGPASMTVVHIRRVGPEGILKGARAVNQRTLCNQPVGWDIEEFEPGHLAERRLHDACARAVRLDIAQR